AAKRPPTSPCRRGCPSSHAASPSPADPAQGRRAGAAASSGERSHSSEAPVNFTDFTKVSNLLLLALTTALSPSRLNNHASPPRITTTTRDRFAAPATSR